MAENALNVSTEEEGPNPTALLEILEDIVGPGIENSSAKELRGNVSLLLQRLQRISAQRHTDHAPEAHQVLVWRCTTGAARTIVEKLRSTGRFPVRRTSRAEILGILRRCSSAQTNAVLRLPCPRTTMEPLNV